MKVDISQLITATEAAGIKGFNSVDAFLYHVNTYDDTPRPVVIGGRRYWHKPDIVKWVPSHKPGPKPNNKGVKNGKKERRDR